MAALSEFSLIKQYFSQLTQQRSDVVLGIGDDCALLKNTADKLVAVSIDTLVEGVHFFPDVDPAKLGYKSLAVGLSDLAAMGAEPAWFTLALTLPEVNQPWLEAFSGGLALLANQHQIQLVGGDTTQGPLTISIQVHGLIAEQSALRRDTAQEGDLIFVSGTLGDAGAALKMRLENWWPDSFDYDDIGYLQARLEQPTPRLFLSQHIRNKASAAIDISDGLLADLGHILERSGKGAVVELNELPLSSTLLKIDRELAHSLALSSGDDYELCFTVAPEYAEQLLAFELDIRCIGKVVNENRLTLLTDGKETPISNFRKGYDHFTK